MKEIPSIQEIESYFEEKGSTVREAQKFFCFYESVAWKVGKKPMEKWRAAASGWILRNQERQPAPVLRPQVDYMRHLRA